MKQFNSKIIETIQFENTWINLVENKIEKNSKIFEFSWKLIEIIQLKNTWINFIEN